MAKREKLRARFGRRVRELRKAQDLTLEKLGERAKVDDKYLQAIETAVQSPTLDVVEKIAAGLGVPVTALFREALPAAPRARVRKMLDEMGEDDVGRLAAVLEAIRGR